MRQTESTVEKRGVRGRARPLGPGQVSPLGENKSRLSLGEGAGKPRHE